MFTSLLQRMQVKTCVRQGNVWRGTELPCCIHMCHPSAMYVFSSRSSQCPVHLWFFYGNFLTWTLYHWLFTSLRPLVLLWSAQWPTDGWRLPSISKLFTYKSTLSFQRVQGIFRSCVPRSGKQDQSHFIMSQWPKGKWLKMAWRFLAWVMFLLGGNFPKKGSSRRNRFDECILLFFLNHLCYFCQFSLSTKRLC